MSQTGKSGTEILSKRIERPVSEVFAHLGNILDAGLDGQTRCRKLEENWHSLSNPKFLEISGLKQAVNTDEITT